MVVVVVVVVVVVGVVVNESMKPIAVLPCPRLPGQWRPVATESSQLSSNLQWISASICISDRIFFFVVSFSDVQFARRRCPIDGGDSGGVLGNPLDP